MRRKYPFNRIQKILNGDDPNPLALENLGKFLVSTSVSEIAEIQREFDEHGSRLQYLAIKYRYPIGAYIQEAEDPSIKPVIYKHLIKALNSPNHNKDDLLKGPSNILDYLSSCEGNNALELMQEFIHVTNTMTSNFQYVGVYEKLLRHKDTSFRTKILHQKAIIPADRAIYIIEIATKNKKDDAPLFFKWWTELDVRTRLEHLGILDHAFNNAFFQTTSTMLLSTYSEFSTLPLDTKRLLNTRDLSTIDRYANVHAEDVKEKMSVHKIITIAIHARSMQYSTFSTWMNHPALPENIKQAFQIWDIHNDPMLMLHAIESALLSREQPTFDLNAILC